MRKSDLAAVNHNPGEFEDLLDLVSDYGPRIRIYTKTRWFVPRPS